MCEELYFATVNVPPPIEAGASCFNENSTTATRTAATYTLSTGVDSRATHGIL